MDSLRQLTLAVAKGLPVGKRPSQRQTPFPEANRPRAGKPGPAVANGACGSKRGLRWQTGAFGGKRGLRQQTGAALANGRCNSAAFPRNALTIL